MSDISNEIIQQIAKQVWSTMLGLDITNANEIIAKSPLITGQINISGNWNGSIQLQTTLAYARLMASAVFKTEPDQLDLSEVIDSLGEMLNIVAGQIKSLLPGSSLLSLPVVTEGTDYRVTTLGSHKMIDVSFTSLDEPIKISMYKKTAVQ